MKSGHVLINYPIHNSVDVVIIVFQIEYFGKDFFIGIVEIKCILFNLCLLNIADLLNLSSFTNSSQPILGIPS